MSRPRNNSNQNTEKDILEAAERLFVEKGFKGATTTLIAAEAGVTHAMLHYYFRTKEQIFSKVLDRYVAKMSEGFKQVMKPQGKVNDVVRIAVGAYFNFLKQHKGHIALILELSGENPEFLRKYVVEFQESIAVSFREHSARFQGEVKAGRIADISFHDLILDIVSIGWSPFMFEPLLRNVIGMDDEQLEAYYENRKNEAIALIGGRLNMKL